MGSRLLSSAVLIPYFTDDSDEQILGAFKQALASAREAKKPFVPKFEVEEIDGRTRVSIRVELGEGWVEA